MSRLASETGCAGLPAFEPTREKIRCTGRSATRHLRREGQDRHDFAIDREAAEKAVAAMPAIPVLARANRAFLVDSVGKMAAAGVSQFLDIGSGLPTSPNVHEVARQTVPDARVVYVYYDPVVVLHSQAKRRVPMMSGCISSGAASPRGSRAGHLDALRGRPQAVGGSTGSVPGAGSERGPQRVLLLHRQVRADQFHGLPLERLRD